MPDRKEELLEKAKAYMDLSDADIQEQIGDPAFDSFSVSEREALQVEICRRGGQTVTFADGTKITPEDHG